MTAAITIAAKLTASHLSLSGTLLETLADPAFQARAYGIVDCGSLLWYQPHRSA